MNIPPMTGISIVVPVYNEEAVLPEFHRRLVSVLNATEYIAEIIYVNDGSSDGTWRVISALKRTDTRVTLISLSRNFGKETALTAGIDYARGEAVVLIDADLQDPPELIPALISEWQAGFDVVYARRMRRDGETNLKKITAFMFYRLIERVSRVEIPADTGDFRLLSRRAVDALRQLREQHRFMKGLFAWIGYPQKAVFYNRDPRYAGSSKFNYWRLWNFALEGITSFTIVPLKVATYTGLFISGMSLIYSIWIVYKTLRYGDPVVGYPSLMSVMTFLGGIQLAFIGVLGEYTGRIFDETKKRPLYLLSAYEPCTWTPDSSHEYGQAAPGLWNYFGGLAISDGRRGGVEPGITATEYRIPRRSHNE